MSKRDELKAERDELAQINDNRRAEIDERAARIAAIDAELAKLPVLPEGWIPASEPPKGVRDYRNVEALLNCYHWAGTEAKRVAWFDSDTSVWRHADCDSEGVYPPIDGTVACWREIPADWLAAQPEPKYPRYFRHKEYIEGDAAYMRFDIVAVNVSREGHGTVSCCPIDRAEAWVNKGDWLEITEAEAEAMVKPKPEPSHEELVAHLRNEPVKPVPAKVEPTTERLMYLSDTAHYTPSAFDHEVREIVRRVEAADHSVDLRTLWEPMQAKHREASWWLAKVQSDGGSVRLAMVYYDDEGNRGAGWYYSHHSKVNDTILAFADPAKLIGGGE